MSVRDSGSWSRAKGAELVVDHLLRGRRSIKKKKIRLKVEGVGHLGSDDVRGFVALAISDSPHESAIFRGVGRPLLREIGPISYEATPS